MMDAVTLVSANPAWWLLAISLMVAGVAGRSCRCCPAPLLVLAGVFVGAWIDSFTRVRAGRSSFIAVLALLAWATDYLAALLGAEGRRQPAAVAGAAIGTLLGIHRLRRPALHAPASARWPASTGTGARRNGGFVHAGEHVLASRRAARVGVVPG